jgi:hypothetical protein
VVKLLFGSQSFTAERSFGYRGARIAFHPDHLAILLIDPRITSTVTDIALTLVNRRSRSFIIVKRLPFFGTPRRGRPVPGNPPQLFSDGPFCEFLGSALRAKMKEVAGLMEDEIPLFENNK